MFQPSLYLLEALLLPQCQNTDQRRELHCAGAYCSCHLKRIVHRHLSVPHFQLEVWPLVCEGQQASTEPTVVAQLKAVVTFSHVTKQTDLRLLGMTTSESHPTMKNKDLLVMREEPGV